MSTSSPTQFGLSRLLVVTSGVAAVMALPRLFGAPPSFSIAAAIVGTSIGVFVLVTSRRTWFLSGIPVVGAALGLVVGVCLYQSPLPGLLYGVLAGIAISQDSIRSTHRRWVALVRGAAIAFLFFLIPCLYTWKHLRARYVLWQARVTVYDDHADNTGQRALEVAFGPHIIPSDTIVWFQDEPRRSIIYTDEVLRQLAPHLESMHGLRSITIKDCARVSDVGVAQLANVERLNSVAVISKQITTKGIMRLQDVSEIESINLQCPQIGDEIVNVLRKYPKLRVLSLHETQVSDEATKTLSDFASLHQLMTSDLVTDETVAELRNTLKGMVGRLEHYTH